MNINPFQSMPSSRLSISASLRLIGFSALIVAGHLLAAGPTNRPNSSWFAPQATNLASPSAIASTAVTPVAANLAPISNAAAAGFISNMDSLDAKHKLAIGDRLSFRIVEDEEEPRQLFVTDSGDLEVPYLGRYPAEGKSCKELARALKTALEKEYYYQATVILAVDLMAKSRGKVYLVGPVRAAGPQEIPSDEVLTLSKAILRAGGFGDFADKSEVRVTRKNPDPAGRDQIFVVNVGLILEKGYTTLDITLEPGDFIYVPERIIRF